ncbi:hypothetical protein [Thioclava sp. GXIMD4215]|uniref:hypothetical protein n=1 Tax=Thioclava sp. GXIMD4215 TaxID=3131928 RepID=UPI0032566DA3
MIENSSKASHTATTETQSSTLHDAPISFWGSQTEFEKIGNCETIAAPTMEDLNAFLKWASPEHFYNLLEHTNGLINKDNYWRLCILFSHKRKMLETFQDYLQKKDPIYTGNPLASPRGQVIHNKLFQHDGSKRDGIVRSIMLLAMIKNSYSYSQKSLVMFVSLQMWREVEILTVAGIRPEDSTLTDAAKLLGINYLKEFQLKKYAKISEIYRSSSSLHHLEDTILKYRYVK